MLLHKSDLVESMVNYYQEISWNENDFNTIIEFIDSYDGYLGDDRYYGMSLLDDLFYGCSPLEIVEKINYGYFNPRDDYFKFDIYGIESTDVKDYSAFIDNYFMEELIDNDHYLSEIEDYNLFDIETDAMLDLIKHFNVSSYVDDDGDDVADIDNDDLTDDEIEFISKYADDEELSEKAKTILSERAKKVA